MKRLALLMTLLLITTVASAQEDSGGPRFSDSNLDNIIAQQQANFEIIKKCSVESFIPPDPEGRVTKVDVRGPEDGSCKVILTTIEGQATYLLPEDVYTRISDIKDLTKGKCSGLCEYVESALGAPPTDDPAELCVRECNARGCGLTALECQRQNRDRCEDECGMVKGPDLSEMDEEQKCISECVSKVDPSIICGSSREGEVGNEVCQRCAAECVYLYAGPCLTDEEITAKERACEVCEHCYGSPVMGDSGEGYECIVDISCEDASAEFGDDPGTGPDSFEPGHEPSADNVYWWDYEATLDVEATGGELVITNNEGETEISVSITTLKGVSLEQHGEKLVIRNQETVFEVDNNIDNLVVSKDGNKRNIENIDIGIEENKPIYAYDETEEVRLLGLIPMNQKSRKKVDAENMYLLQEDKPWWSLLTVKPAGPDNCGDGICGSLTHVENSFTCPSDCAETFGAEEAGKEEAAELAEELPEELEAFCGDDNCDPSESGETCPEDCLENACGNGVCEYGEDKFSDEPCPSDCSWCGDGICGNNELKESGTVCPKDCLTACGDKVCNGQETYTTCLVDCGFCGDSFCGYMESFSKCPNDCSPGCGNSICEFVESPESCPVDCTPACGNNICEGGQNHENCIIDCPPRPNEDKWAENLLGNGVCDGGENPENAAFDCGWCGDSVCGYTELNDGNCPADCPSTCGDGVCEGEETYTTCLADCGICGDGFCVSGEDYTTCVDDCPDIELNDCGDGECKGLEDSENCAADCSEESCGDGKCSKHETMLTCPADCEFTCGDNFCAPGEECPADCSVNCGDGVCFGAEDQDSCPEDCEFLHKLEVVYQETTCGNGVCEDAETTETCGTDCTAVCGDGVCGFVEDSTSCNIDCSASCGNGVCDKSEGDKICPIDCSLCGDGICTPKEEALNCPLDCKLSCSNGLCEQNENAENCPYDCAGLTITRNVVCGYTDCEDGSDFCIGNCGVCGDGICAPTEKGGCAMDCQSACGNGVCEQVENAETCPFDCVG